MMSQQSGDPFADLIRVNTAVQAVTGIGNRDIRGETRAEYQGRQEGQKAGRYQSKKRETVQSQNTMIVMAIYIFLFSAISTGTGTNDLTRKTKNLQCNGLLFVCQDTTTFKNQT